MSGLPKSPKAGRLCCCGCPELLAEGRREVDELVLLLLMLLLTEGYFGSSGLMIGEGSGVKGESELARESEVGRLFDV